MSLLQYIHLLSVQSWNTRGFLSVRLLLSYLGESSSRQRATSASRVCVSHQTLRRSKYRLQSSDSHITSPRAPTPPQLEHILLMRTSWRWMRLSRCGKANATSCMSSWQARQSGSLTMVRASQQTQCRDR